jgi:spore photoproduct lyase
MLETKTMPVVKDYNELESQIDAFLGTKVPEILDSGEIADSLMSERYKSPFSRFIIPKFQDTRHKILFLTKSDYVDNILELDGQKNTIMSFTVNAKDVAEKWEKRAPSPERRLIAAKKVADKGYEVRLRIDPIVPVYGWKSKYHDLIEDIANVGVERVTLGTLRGLRSTLIHAKDKSWVEFLKDGEKTNFGRRLKHEDRFEIYDYIIRELNKKGIMKVGVCKETVGMWKELGMIYKDIACNCTK